MLKLSRTVLVLAFFLASSAFGSKYAQMAPGYYITQAELIVLCDSKQATASSAVQLHVKEMLKGDPKLVGEDLLLSGLFGSHSVRLPSDGKNLVVILGADWGTSPRGPLAVYSKASDVLAIRQLIPIVAVPDERPRLLALKRLLPEGKSLILTEYLTELAAMRQASNLDIMLEIPDGQDEQTQARLIKIMGGTCDPRVVPVLAKALSSPHLSVRTVAARALYFELPGAEGVLEAFAMNWEREGVAWYASRYLAARTTSPRYQAAIPPDTPWILMQRMDDQGDRAGARKLRMQLALDTEASAHVRRGVALTLIQDASSDEMASLRVSLMPMLQELIEEGTYTADVASILRAFHHQDCLDPLIEILRYSPSRHLKSTLIATLAIRELGEAARQKAVATVAARMTSETPREASGLTYPASYVLELIWLANQEELVDARAQSHPSFQSAFRQLEPLIPLGLQSDEGAFLIAALQSDPHGLGSDGRAWTVLRLGDLGDERAIDVLAQLINPWYSNNPRHVISCLLTIGGPAVEAMMTTLLTHDDGPTRAAATEILAALQAERALPLARRILQSENYGDRYQALRILSRHGTLEDLPRMEAQARFWGRHGDNYHARDLLVGIRDRLNHDLAGPINIVDDPLQD